MKTLLLPPALWLAIASLVSCLNAQSVSELDVENPSTLHVSESGTLDPEMISSSSKQLEDMNFKFYYDLAELQKPIDALLNQYLEQLRLAKNQYQQAGNLDAVLAFEQEIEELKSKELGKGPELSAPEHPLVIKMRQEYLTKHTAVVSRNYERNYDAAIALSRRYADKLNALVVERTKAGKLQEARAFKARLDELRTVMTIYRQLGKADVEISSWVKETLRYMPERLQPAGGALPKLGVKGRAAGEVRQVQLTKDVTMDFCWCPPGKFTMGSPESEAGRGGNENQVEVTFSEGFWMSKTEVTQAQWQTVMGRNPSHFKGANRPVETVSWNDAKEFLTKLNAIVGDSDGGKMILPTEAQWEYAARAGETGSYSGGALDEVAWYGPNSGGQTHSVGTKKPNAWGFYDMHGNVWEWCADWHDDELSGGNDPRGPRSGSNRVGRGGGWDGSAIRCRVAARSRSDPAIQNYVIGLRVARSSVP